MRLNLLALLVVAATVTACSVSGPRQGDLIREEPGELCIESLAGAPIQYALTVLTNSSDSDPALIESVELVGASGMSVTEAWVLPLDEWEDEVTGEAVDAARFADHQEITADNPARIEPGSTLGLVVSLNADDAGGSAERIRVLHHVDEQNFYSDGGNRIDVAPFGATCASQ